MLRILRIKTSPAAVLSNHATVCRHRFYSVLSPPENQPGVKFVKPNGTRYRLSASLDYPIVCHGFCVNDECTAQPPLGN